MSGLFDDLIKPAPGAAQPKSASGLFDDMIKLKAPAHSTENGTVLSAIDEGGRKLYALAKNAVSSGPSTLTQDLADAEKAGAKPHATLVEAGKSILHGVQSIGSNLKQEFSSTDTAAKDRSVDDRSYAGKPIAFGVTTDDPDSLGFSLAGMANSLAGRTAGAMAGGAAGGTRGAAIGQEAGALTAGGVGTYNMSAYQFAKQFADKADQEAMSTLGRHLTDDERVKVVNENIDHIRHAAMWEAGPEALGNMLEIPMLGKIAGNAAKIGSKEAANAAMNGGLKAAIKRMSESTAGELAKSVGTELTTEAATQIGQSDTNHLLDPNQQVLSFAKPGDWGEALKEVAPATLFTMGMMGGGAHLGGKLYNRVTGNGQAAVGQNQGAPGIDAGGVASAPEVPPAPGIDQGNPRESFDPAAADAQWGQRIRTVEGDVLPPEAPKGPLSRAALAAPGVNFQPPEQGVLPRQAIGSSMGDPLTESQPALPRQMVEDKTRTGEVLPPDATLPHPVAGLIDLAPIEGSATRIDDAAHAAATSPFNNAPEPTKAQQDAGNYRKGHIKLHGLDIAIENPQASIRRGVDAKGKPWGNVMPAHYGYIKRTTGNDGDHVDTFIGPNPDSKSVFVVDQVDPKTGKFDEHKVMLGFDSQAEADKAYHAAYAKGWTGAKKITSMDVGAFKAWLNKGNTKRPLWPVSKRWGGVASDPQTSGLIGSNNPDQAMAQVAASPKRGNTAMTDPRLATHGDTIERMARDESGWTERGGKMIRDAKNGEVTGRTQWVPNASWWAERPALPSGKRLNESQTLAAVQRARSGDPLSSLESASVQHLLGEAERISKETEAHVTPENVVESGYTELDKEEAFYAIRHFDSDEDFAWMDGLEQDIPFDIGEKDGRSNLGENAVSGQEKSSARGSDAGVGAGARTQGVEGKAQAGGVGQEERPGLSLTSQTESQARADDLTHQKEAEAKRQRDNAPPPDEFALTGSDRNADVAAAHGAQDLFSDPPQSNTRQVNDKPQPSAGVSVSNDLSQKFETAPDRPGLTRMQAAKAWKESEAKAKTEFISDEARSIYAKAEERRNNGEGVKRVAYGLDAYLTQEEFDQIKQYTESKKPNKQHKPNRIERQGKVLSDKELDSVMRKLMDYTDNNGSPDALTGAEHLGRRKELISILTGIPESEIKQFDSGVNALEALLYKAASIKGGSINEQRGNFLDWIDAKETPQGARLYSRKREAPVIGKTGDKPTDFLTFNGSTEAGRITDSDVAQAKENGVEIKAGPVRLMNGRHFGPNKGFGVEHINAEHGADIASVGKNIAEFVYDVLRTANQIWAKDDGRLIFYRTGKHHAMTVVELREQNGAYSVITAYSIDKNKQAALSADRRRGKVELVVRDRNPSRPDNQRVSLPEPLAGNRSDTALNPVLEPLADQSNNSSVNQDGGNLKLDATEKLNSKEKAPAAYPRDTPSQEGGERATSAYTGADSFSRQTSPQSTIPEIRNALQDAFGKRADRLLNSGNVVVVQSEHDVPGSADHIQSEDGDSAPQAFFDPKTNKIYLVADGLHPADVAGVMKHEALHKFEHDNPGVFDPAMKQLLAMMRTSLFNGSGAVPAWFNQAWRNVPPDTSPKHVPSEIAAYAVASREGLPDTVKRWVEDFVATIRAALIRMGFAPKQITDADLAALARYQIRRMSNSESFADKVADLIGRIREKRGDHGSDAAGQMASRLKSAMGKPGYASAIMKMLARVDGNNGLFRYPKAPESMKSLEDVTNAVSEGMASAHETEMDGGNVDNTWVITMPKGDPVFVMEKGDSVWINASALESGEGMGSLAYSIVGNYAHNAGKVFIGDPDGLSVKALFRRTEHMANLALKFGTTKFLMPHDAQVDPKSYYGNRASVLRGDDKAAALAEPIKWGSDDRANLEQLLGSAYNNTVALAPGIENVRYDFDHQRFVDGTGQVLDEQGFNRIARKAAISLARRGVGTIANESARKFDEDAARSIVGSSTLQRSALFNSILRASSDPLSWRSVLDSASRQLSGNQLDEPLQRRFYSKAQAPSDGGFSLGDRLSHGEISQVVEELTGKFAHEIPVSIVNSITDVLPSASANDGNASGVVLNGRIHLIRSGLTDRASVARTLFHEMLHYGLRRFMGKDEYVSTMHELYDSDAYIRNKANQWMQSEEGRAIKGSEDYIKARATDEALAGFSEILQGQADSRRNNSLQARVIRTVSRWIANTAKAMGFHDAAAQWEGINNDKARALIGDVFGKLRTDAEKTDGGWHYSDPAWRTIPTVEKAKEAIGKINQTDSAEVHGDHFTLPPVTKAENAQANLQDKFNRWKLVQDAIAKQGGKLLDKINVYLAEERYHKILASKLSDFREKTAIPMAHGWSRDGINADQMASLLYAQHAPERNKAMQAINPNVKTGSGMSDSDAAAVIAHVKSLPNADAYFKAADRLRAISNRSLDIAVEKGVIPQDMADAFREKYKYYVPLKGWESVDETGANSMGNGTGRGLSVSRGLIQAVGRDSKAGMIIENILHDHEAAIARGEKNEVGRVMLDFLRANPDQALWRIENVAQKPAVGTKDGEPMVVLRNSMSLDDNQVKVFENGEQRVVTFADNVLGEQYNDLGTERLPTVLRALTGYNRFLSAMYTAKNPVFIVKNLMRDMQSGMINLVGEVGLSEARKTLKYYGGAMKAMVQYASGKEVAGDWGDWIKQYREAGGQTGMGWVQGLEDISKKLAMEYDKETGAKNLLKEGRKLRAAQVASSKAFHAVTDAIEHANIGIENALRLAAFRQAIESGTTQERATSLAANLTVNFDRKGKWTPALGGLYLFFNPRVQGFARVLQAMTKGIHRKQALALMGSMALASLLLTELARGFGDDDDEEKYLNIPEGERGRNWIFMIGGRRIMLPIPLDYLPFAALGKLISDIAHGKPPSKAGEQMALALLDAGIPLTITGQDGIDSGSVAQGFIPTAGQMPVRIGMNKNGMGGDLMPGTDFTPDNQRMWNGTRGTSYDKVAQALAAVGFEVSPESMKEIVRTTTGGLGTFLQQVGDGTVNLATGKDTKSENVPMLSAFTKTESIKDLRSAFYSASNDAREELGRFESGVKHGGDTNGQRMELVAMGRQAEKLNVVLGKQNRAMAAVRSNETMPGDQKDRVIQQMETAQGRMYESYLRAYRAKVGSV